MNRFIPTRRFEQSNATHLTASEGSRHLRDPYEEQYVEVRKSSLLKANREMSHLSHLKLKFWSGMHKGSVRGKKWHR